jgi:hypothetical protein
MEKLKFVEAILDRLQEYSVSNPEHDTDDMLSKARKELEKLNKNYVLIENTEHIELLDNQRTLYALHRGGVDNWEWYDESLSSLD